MGMLGMDTLSSPSGLWCEINANGSLRRMGRGAEVLGLFVGNAVEGAPANLWLRRRVAGRVELLPLLGPASASHPRVAGGRFQASGAAPGLRWQLALVLAQDAPAWFWHLLLHNTGSTPQTLELLQVQDIALTAYANVRLNEHYVSHYIDMAPLRHAARGWVVAARQNLAVGGRHPWALLGSLREAAAFATDGRQLRDLRQDLPATRLQHEHACIGLQDAPLHLAPGESAAAGFFGRIEADHPAASSAADLAWVQATLALPEATAPVFGPAAAGAAPQALPLATLFSHAPWLPALDLADDTLAALCGADRRNAEHDSGPAGALLSFFSGAERHVVLPAKERRVLRPHGHILRGGTLLVPDESALTSTVWMQGVFHSMVTQGHVSLNRLLSTVHGYLGQFRSQGQRIFVQAGGGWQQLGMPSAFTMEPGACRWIYRHAGGLFSVQSRVLDAPQALALDVEVLQGGPLRLRVSHHLALAGDDGSAGPAPPWQMRGDAVFITPPAGSEMALRFPGGGFAVAPAPGSVFTALGGDEMLFADGAPHGEPLLCIDGEAAPHFGLRITGHLVQPPAGTGNTLPLPLPLPLSMPLLQAPPASPLAGAVQRLADSLPWLLHNALVHYLAPRGLEQYSGGGWGTRDVCQGPLELLLACGRTAPVRDLLLRTFAAQNPDGDWPQWFMFFERERAIRAGDAHGDIVFWPLLALARYLLASGDAALLDAPLPFHGGGAPASVWQHAQQALVLTRQRRIAGTHLAAYGHGDWNDALQPADPALRERLCSAWTVTLHHQMLLALAAALRSIGRAADALPLEAEAAQVGADFERLLVADGVVTGYALFPPDAADGAAPELLLHPADRRTGLHYSLLPMMHAVLEEMLPPPLAQAQLALIEQHLTGPDGARLFDAPMAYRGGPQTVFQRAESSAYFGREIGVMYMHAHLRYAETLAHVGDADGFFAALCRAHAVGLQTLVPSAALRQANCYHSSSDAAFSDRYAASRDYAAVAAGSVALEGGWRIYSSGPGIALGLLLRQFAGVTPLAHSLLIDPVLPPALDGLQITLDVCGQPLRLHYAVAAPGHGVQALWLDGVALPFTRRANRYRVGAAEVQRAPFGSGARLLRIEIGALKTAA